ncbi:unnamed protein product, partial [marine sediment metagenome]
GGTDNYSGTLSMATFDLDVVGVIDIICTFIIGVSAGTGLTTGSINWRTGATVTMAEDSKVFNGGNYTCNGVVFSTTYRGEYVQTGNGTWTCNDGSNSWYKFTVNVGVTSTLAGNGKITQGSSHTTIINGTLALGVGNQRIGASNILTFGASSAVTGSGSLQLMIKDSATYTFSASTMAFTGNIDHIYSGATQLAVTGDWRNAIYKLNFSTGKTFILAAGTLSVNDFEFEDNGVSGNTADCATNNPTINVYEDIDFDPVAGSLTWNK